MDKRIKIEKEADEREYEERQNRETQSQSEEENFPWGTTQVKRENTPNVEASLDDLFEEFSVFGDRWNEEKNISLRNVDKWFAQAQLFDGIVTNADTAIEFSKIARNKKKLDREEFQEFLSVLADQKGMPVEELEARLRAAGPPDVSGTTKPIRGSVAAESMRRLTDPSLYTGTHKERFDAEGKGKGLSGRYDTAEDDGYVQGFKPKRSPEDKQDQE
ncbi:tubulin polymerization-promoting protein homolog [Stegodyphus dumicola]|uniref:tubulin polymerization-promoting protein homolog n=1 Tax=Stegodyphus dumicola TaxID=202533 RepID=UPI0015AE424E|nr:tubulin polymerization-promoting protein homolog [Stegodyphus dumicola]